MSALVRLRAIAYGYRVELHGSVVGSVKRIRTEDGQAWAATATIHGHAPLPWTPHSLRDAVRKILVFVRENQ